MIGLSLDGSVVDADVVVVKEKIIFLCVSVCCLDAASSTVCPAPQSIWPVIQIEYYLTIIWVSASILSATNEPKSHATIATPSSFIKSCTSSVR